MSKLAWEWEMYISHNLIQKQNYTKWISFFICALLDPNDSSLEYPFRNYMHFEQYSLFHL